MEQNPLKKTDYSHLVNSMGGDNRKALRVGLKLFKMAHLNLIATGSKITVAIDTGWISFTVNTQPLGGSVTVDSTASFTGEYGPGSVAVPWNFMTFIDPDPNSSKIWIAVIQFTNSNSGNCTVSGIVAYANKDANFDITKLVATLLVTEPSASTQFIVNNAGTNASPAPSQTFSAYGLTGIFVANIN